MRQGRCSFFVNLENIAVIWTNAYEQHLTLFRASTPAHVNFSSILHGKSYFFYFTHLFLQNTRISSSIIQDILYK